MIEILGSSVSALVATERLMAAGVAVRRTPSGRPSPFGFHVLPDGRSVEVGCKLLELYYGDPWSAVPPLAEFKPGSQHGHRPWIETISEYVRDLIDVGPKVERKAQRHRVIVDDPFLSGDPSGVVDLLEIDDETELAVFDLSLGSAGPPRGWATFAEQALENCGRTIFEGLVWPLLHKIAGWADVPAAQHRKVWLPLWRPESLLDALRGEPSYWPVRPMHFGCGALYEALEAATKDVLGEGHRDGFPMFASDYDLCDFHMTDGRSEPDAVSIRIAWIADDHAPGVEWLIDGDVPVFRRTWRGDDICCVEYAAGANIERWCYDQGHDLLDKMEVRVPIGDVACGDVRAVGYGSLNDQIVQGLAAADRLMRERA